jgi:hypothetical protein
MAKLTMMLSMIFLSLGVGSCGTVQQKLLCAQINEARIAPKRFCDISIKFNRCRCRCLDMDTWSSLPLKECADGFGSDETTINLELEACEGIGGFPLPDIAEDIGPKMRLLSGIREDYCGK